MSTAKSEIELAPVENTSTNVVEKTKDNSVEQETMNHTAYLLFAVQVVCIVVFAIWGGTQEFDNHLGNSAALDGYNMYLGTMVMMLVGFGYLMTFMQYYGMGAVGFCLLVSALGMQWGLIIDSFWIQLQHNDWHGIHFDLYSMFLVTTFIGAPLISLGGVIGKVTPFQLIVMVLIEFTCQTFVTEVLLLGNLKVVDLGGTLAVHMFGCYFGLAVAYMVGNPKTEPPASIISDLLSLIGTTFLWAYWPSFVSGYTEKDSPEQQRALTNTIMSLCASTVTAFACSSYFNKQFNKDSRFRPVDIQNATLAGGVSIGCLANFNLNPGLTIFVGALSGFLSAFGYAYIQPMLLDKFDLHDTCGINNLHGMPSILGGIISVIVIALQGSSDLYNYKEESTQAYMQLIGVLVTLATAIACGLLTGKFLTLFAPKNEAFHDAAWWEIVDEPVTVNPQSTKHEYGTVSSGDDNDTSIVATTGGSKL